MNLQTHSLDTVSPGARTVKKPFRKSLSFCALKLSEYLTYSDELAFRCLVDSEAVTQGLS